MTSLLNALPGSISQGLIWGIMAIGVYITYRLLDVADLTVDGSFCTGGAMCAVTLANGKDWLGAIFGAETVEAWAASFNLNIVILIMAVLFAFMAGLLAGMCTGLLHTACGIPAILAGILTQLGLWSVNLVTILDKKASLAINVRKMDLLVALGYIKDVENGKRWFIQHPIFVAGIFTIVIIGILYWFFGTELGSSIRATGANRAMARAQGINTNKNTVLGLMLSNGLVALSGALLAQYQGFAEINMGRGAIVIGLAAVIIGEVVFGKLFRNFGLKLLAVSIGAVIYYIVIQAVISLSGIDSNYLKLLTAIIVAFFLAVPYWKGKYFTKPVKRGGAQNA
ncbi:MAG: ABC transporter permease [Clostridiales bacterium]|nr:ABC transporter permease [Clostridiales bacterium]